jgi:hypothetical protein
MLDDLLRFGSKFRGLMNIVKLPSSYEALMAYYGPNSVYDGFSCEHGVNSMNFNGFNRYEEICLQENMETKS